MFNDASQGNKKNFNKLNFLLGRWMNLSDSKIRPLVDTK